MSQLCIPKGGSFQQTWFVSGLVLPAAYSRMVGFTNPGTGSPFLFDWSTSGGQLSVTGSTVSGLKIAAFVRTSGTSGLDFTIGAWQMSVWHTSGTDAGSVLKFYDAGRVDLVPYNVGGL